MCKKEWQTTKRTCWCGETFTPKTYNQKHCSKEHARIHETAKQSNYGRRAMKNNPEQAMEWYKEKRKTQQIDDEIRPDRGV